MTVNIVHIITCGTQWSLKGEFLVMNVYIRKDVIWKEVNEGSAQEVRKWTTENLQRSERRKIVWKGTQSSKTVNKDNRWFLIKYAGCFFEKDIKEAHGEIDHWRRAHINAYRQ